MTTGQPLKIVFAGTPDFAVPPLRRLITGPHSVQAVLTQPDKPAGRGRKLRQSPVKQVAQQADIPVWQPASLRDAEWQQRLAELKPDLMVVVAYGLILPQAVLDIPRHGCWNIHASLLPRWRGAAPIQRAILAGDRHTGVCIMRMEAGLDTGPVYRRKTTPINPQDTAGNLHDRLSVMGAEALEECLHRLAGGTLPDPVPQDEHGVTYAHKITTEEALIDWQQPATAIVRQINAFNPWPGARAEIAGQTCKIWRAHALDEAPAKPEQTPGSIRHVDKQTLHIQCGEGVLAIDEIQQAGKRRLPIGDYLNAHSQRLADAKASGSETP